MKTALFLNARRSSRGILRTRLILLIMLSLAALSQAGLYSVTRITNNGPGLVIDPWQFTVDVQDFSASQVLLTFSNAGIPSALPSSIKEIYIDDALISFDAFMGLQPGRIEFSTRTNGKLPGGGLYGFSKDDFCACAARAAPRKGLNPGESLGLLFNLNGYSYADINAAIGAGRLPVGMHVISIANGPTNVSESFIIPEPGTLVLLGAGCVLLSLFGRSQFVTR